MRRGRRKGSKLGRLFLAVSRGASRMSDGMDRVFGEDRKTPGDGFSKARAGRRAAAFTEKARKDGKASGLMDKNKDTDFFGKTKGKEDDERFF